MLLNADEYGLKIQTRRISKTGEVWILWLNCFLFIYLFLSLHVIFSYAGSYGVSCHRFVKPFG